MSEDRPKTRRRGVSSPDPNEEHRPVMDIAFTDSVKAAQTRYGSRTHCTRREQSRHWKSAVTDDLAAFIASRDSFYLGTASRMGRPYIQHRGGPPGFLTVLDAKTLGFADYPGNRQYITAGNLMENDQAFIFLMDYPTRQRIKLWGRASVVDDDPALLRRLHHAGVRCEPERAILFSIEAWDVNCRQYIVPRYTEEQVAAIVARMQARIGELERELAAR